MTRTVVLVDVLLLDVCVVHLVSFGSGSRGVAGAMEAFGTRREEEEGMYVAGLF